MSTVTIAPLTEKDYTAWLPLWDGNNMGARNDAVTAQTWARLTDPGFPVHGLGAFIDGRMAGLVHYVVHPTTGSAQMVCYMQDLYVDPAQRRKGIARALVEYLSDLGRIEKWARIYWLAEGKNAAAQNFYRHIGLKLDFTLHVMPLT